MVSEKKDIPHKYEHNIFKIICFGTQYLHKTYFGMEGVNSRYCLNEQK